jgi:serine/threonine protein kinase
MRRRVAVKVLYGTKAQDRTALERFRREARAAAALDHPNIVRAFDVGQDDHLHFLAMEFVDGVSLQDLVRKRGPLPQGIAADYLRQAALGLQHAHEAGLVHRDLKPSNLMVDRRGGVKILDLGLARFHEDNGDLTRGAVLGVEDYIAPEQVLDSHTVDIRADVYSLGAVFYFCLTGKPPRKAGTAAVAPSARRKLMNVIHKMMAQEPEHRFATPADVAEAAAPLANPTTSPSQPREARGRPAPPTPATIPDPPEFRLPPAPQRRPVTQEKPAQPPSVTPSARRANARPPWPQSRALRWGAAVGSALVLVALSLLFWWAVRRP